MGRESSSPNEGRVADGYLSADRDDLHAEIFRESEVLELSLGFATEGDGRRSTIWLF
ncbi:hypothetical protein NXC24_PC01468 (plasmid) [Rhizobium sp. NXC24]|nr:hypothetical protein NXC24_PC01468 [Rhizobium sp. NXC24]